MSGLRSQPEASKRVVEETRRLYLSLLSKPLDERQLARPTFKFIQDVVKNLITETRMLRKEFNASDFEQASSKSPWDKRRRSDFIQRLIDFVANNKQPVVGCVASKLVAGLEPVKCNELLQALAKITASRRQDNSKSRTFTRAEPSLSSNRIREPSASGSNASQVTSRASSRHSSASARRASKDEPIIESKTDSSSSRNNKRAGGRGSGSNELDSNSPNRHHSAKKEKFNAPTADVQSATQKGATEDTEFFERHESVKELVDKLTPMSGSMIDTDMSRNIQVLRSNLRAFQRVLSDVDHLEEQLRSRLQQSVTN